MRLPLVLLAFLQPAAALVVSRAKLPRLVCRGGAEGSEDAGSSPLYPALDAHETGSIQVGIHDVAYAIYGNPQGCLLYTSPSPRDQRGSRMPSSA